MKSVGFAESSFEKGGIYVGRAKRAKWVLLYRSQEEGSEGGLRFRLRLGV